MFINITPKDERWYNLEDLPNEEWRDIKDFEGLYQVSNYGRVKSCDRFKKHYSKNVEIPCIIRKLGLDNDGYYILALNKVGKKYTKKVHRLVAEAFIAKSSNFLVVNHLDCNPKNNRVDNLEWCTIKENNKYCRKLGRSHVLPTRGRKGDNPQSKKVYQYDKTYNLIGVWYCAEDVANVLNVSRKTIGKCCRGEIKTVKNFILSYRKNGD